MLESLLDNILDVAVGKTVKNVLPRLAVGDKIRLAKYLQLMGYRGFRHTEKLCNVTNAHSFFVYCKKDAHSRRVTENLKKIR